MTAQRAGDQRGADKSIRQVGPFTNIAPSNDNVAVRRSADGEIAEQHPRHAVVHVVGHFQDPLDGLVVADQGAIATARSNEISLASVNEGPFRNHEAMRNALSAKRTAMGSAPTLDATSASRSPGATVIVVGTRLQQSKIGARGAGA
jgi:hypothetical protein